MSEPILDPKYWRRRLETATQLHHAIFKCSGERWKAIEAKHREILTKLIQPNHSILDAGCGWGRLLELMPSGWYGDYLGIDLSPDFVDMAQKRYPLRRFCTLDLRNLSELGAIRFDWAVLISIRPMVRRNLGETEWGRMEWELTRRTSRTLYLEYDPADEGSVE